MPRKKTKKRILDPEDTHGELQAKVNQNKMQIAESADRIVDMSGGVPRRRAPARSTHADGSQSPYKQFTIKLPDHEHSKLRSASHQECKPMSQLIREAMLIGLRVKKAHRDGDKVVIIDPSGRRKAELT